ncbi:ABC-type antimicrobial peptide transport system permease subunit [Algoriphagus sp. 4150]|uniref:ABC transporter permease n=1 Tax=Algoriphagus sp. 4150 TaxID=2817756 RepID=UPI002854CB07|nr:FtsX-like permease family protein [Algoriphagus sp. 4150]MDR7131863.1 ABC-type antimicrobial peptide transport system permease subunit [Algoriphagus sp. 4150]
MIKNYLKTSLRNLYRHKGYTLINILGLGVGLATCMLILLWAMDEWKYDGFHDKSDRIYSVLINNTYPDGEIKTHGATPSILAEAIEEEIPEVELIARTSMNEKLLLKHEKNSFLENGIYAEPALFEIFSFPILKGDRETLNENRNTIAISEKLAEKLFADIDPIGMIVEVNQQHQLVVNSVFADIPSHSTIQFDFVLPFEIFLAENPWSHNWPSGGTRTYVALHRDIDVEVANLKLSPLVSKNCPDCSSNPFLFQYSRSRLFSKFQNGQEAGGKIENVVLFCLIGLIILVMACINFTNLATARASTRGKEVGVRKAIGSRRSSLMLQFLMESTILSFMALVISLALVNSLLPYFSEVTRKNITWRDLDYTFLLGAGLLTLVCGLLAGAYPAFFLSSFKSISIMKEGNTPMLTGSRLRKSLVVIQLAASVTLVICSLAVYSQLEYITKKDLGYEKENVIIVDPQQEVLKNPAVFKQELLNYPGIQSAGFAGSDILTIPIVTDEVSWPGKPESSTVFFKLLRCDQDFLPTLDIPIVAGRNFSMEQQKTPLYMLNKKAIEVMGINAEEAIGMELDVWNGLGQVIGVTEDFHNNSLREDIEPMVFMYSTDVGFHYYIKTKSGYTMDESLAHIEKTMKKLSPDQPFEYSFLDEAYEREYQMEKVLGKLSLGFTIVALLIVCLGLFGLSSFAAAKRVKEMGIRKVFGASPGQLWTLLCKDFVILTSVGLLIGIPIAWYMAKNYLSGFAYHATLGIGVYLYTVIGLLGIALLTVTFQSLKTALINPVNSLRDE